jgi:hypothetical protein
MFCFFGDGCSVGEIILIVFDFAVNRFNFFGLERWFSDE